MSAKVMIIDDDRFITTLYERRLKQEGFEVVTALDGREAVEKLRTERPQAILLDMMLPKVHGSQVLSFIRVIPELADVPVIIHTACEPDALIRKAEATPHTYYAPKGKCSPPKIVGVLRQAVAEGAVFEEVQGEPKPADTAPPTGEQERDGASLDVALRQDMPEVDPDVEALLHSFLRQREAEPQKELLLDLYQSIQPQLKVARRADAISSRAQLCRALEVLFENLYAEPVGITASSSRTLSGGLEQLRILCSPEIHRRSLDVRPFLVLALSANPRQRELLKGLLNQQWIRTLTVHEADTALTLATENRFDVIVLDPDQSLGCALFCRQLRKLKKNADTPLLQLDDAPRADGSSDRLMETISREPLNPSELPLKVLTLALRRA